MYRPNGAIEAKGKFDGVIKMAYGNITVRVGMLFHKINIIMV